MINIQLAEVLANNVCITNKWELAWEQIKPVIDEKFVSENVNPDDLALIHSAKDVIAVVNMWEAEQEYQFHNQMRATKMKAYDNKVYTIQNNEGDRGFIQWIDEECIAHDEVMGGSEEINPDYFHIYLVINPEEYEIIKNLHALYNEFGTQEYLDMIEKMIDLTIENNKHKLF